MTLLKIKGHLSVEKREIDALTYVEHAQMDRYSNLIFTNFFCSFGKLLAEQIPLIKARFETP